MKKLFCGAQAQSSATEQSGEFREGDIVRIRSERADMYVQPMRRWGHQGRTASVVRFLSEDRVVLQFHTRRAPKHMISYREVLDPRDLELVERPTEQSGSTELPAMPKPSCPNGAQITSAAGPAYAVECSVCCRETRKDLPWPLSQRPFIVCPQCGNKRCPKASWHGNECTGSNDSGQIGSFYGPEEHWPSGSNERVGSDGEMRKYNIYHQDSGALLAQHASGWSCRDAVLLHAEENAISPDGLVAVAVGFDGSFEFFGPEDIEHAS